MEELARNRRGKKRFSIGAGCASESARSPGGARLSLRAQHSALPAGRQAPNRCRTSWALGPPRSYALRPRFVRTPRLIASHCEYLLLRTVVKTTICGLSLPQLILLGVESKGTG